MLRSVKYGLYGAVLAGVVGGTVAWTNVDKTVHLVVDGRSTTVHTTASDVGDVLKTAGYKVGVHDLLAPSPSSSVRDGGTIVFKRGRLLRLDVNGADDYVWTTAPTVAQALSDLGFTQSDFISVSRSRRLPLSATDISVRTPKYVIVRHDGQVNTLSTTDATVGQVLSDLSLKVGRYDRLSVPKSAALAADAQITLTRVQHKTLTATHAVPFKTTSTKDASLPTGTTKTVTPGRIGLAQVSWAAVYVDGKLVGKTKLGTTTLHQPIAQVRRIGTKEDDSDSSSGSASSSSSSSGSSGSTPTKGSAQAIAKSLLASYGWSDQFSCLNNIYSRESGWRVNAANGSGAYGIPQALPGSKMSSAGPDWQNNATTQIKWGLNYIKARYQDPCHAWSVWQSQGWY